MRRALRDSARNCSALVHLRTKTTEGGGEPRSFKTGEGGIEETSLLLLPRLESIADVPEQLLGRAAAHEPEELGFEEKRLRVY